MSGPILKGYSVYATPADLPEQYQRHVREVAKGLLMFHHPAMVQIFPVMIREDIETYLTRWRAFIDDLRDQKKWTLYLNAFERAYRMTMLVDLAGDVDVTNTRECVRFWQTAHWAWTDSEIDEGSPEWGELLECGVPHREAMMPRAARQALRAMPMAVTVYRGVQVGVHDEPAQEAWNGFSWTTDVEVARFFAHRMCPADKTPVVVEATVLRLDIMVYTNDRNEKECIISPDVVDWEHVEFDVGCPKPARFLLEGEKGA